MQPEYKFSFWATVLIFTALSCSSDEAIKPLVVNDLSVTETFIFSSNGVDIKGKIFLPDSNMTNTNLPTIYLIDYKEQHFAIATDEFEQVIGGVQQVPGLDALVVTLDAHPDIDSKAILFQDYYKVFRDMTSFVDNKYTDNTSRTFIGRGSEGGVVLLALLLEDPATSVFDNFIVTDSPTDFNAIIITMIENDDIQENMTNKKLHFSFSSDNDHDECTKLISHIEAAQFPWLDFTSREYPDSGYETTYPYSFAAGIKFIFDQ
jgi:hypothetical protein